MPGSVGSFTFRLPGKEIVLSSEPFVCLGRHIRSHIRGIEGTVQLWLRVCFSARALYIRPQRKFACSRSFQISFISVPSFPVKLFPTHLQTGTSICSVPGSKTLAFFFPLGLWICCLHYIPSYPVCQ